MGCWSGLERGNKAMGGESGKLELGLINVGSKLQDCTAGRSPREPFGAQRVWLGEEKEKEIPLPRAFRYLTLSSARLWEAAVTRTTLQMRKQRL